MAIRGWLGVIIGCALGATPPAACADAVAHDVTAETAQAAPSRFDELLSVLFAPTRSKHPEWVREQSSHEFDPDASRTANGTYLMLQQDRRDGADLLTVRQPLLERGGMRAYAGAGLSRATYYAGEDGSPQLLAKRGRRSSLGPAAELGAEFRLGDRLLLNTELRWTDFDNGAELLRGEDGPLSADPVVVGLTVGWRFR